MYRFMGEHRSLLDELQDDSPKLGWNPIQLVYEWRRLLRSRKVSPKTEWARVLGFSRARATQILRLLYLSPEIVQSIISLGDPMPEPFVAERTL